MRLWQTISRASSPADEQARAVAQGLTTGWDVFKHVYAHRAFSEEGRWSGQQSQVQCQRGLHPYAVKIAAALAACGLSIFISLWSSPHAASTFFDLVSIWVDTICVRANKVTTQHNGIHFPTCGMTIPAATTATKNASQGPTLASWLALKMA